jgi:beta-glucosidase
VWSAFTKDARDFGGRELTIKVTVKNTGERAATEVAQFYLSDLEASTIVPLHKLVGFEQVTLEPGESRTLAFTLTPEMMSFFDENGQLTLEPGEFRIEAGGCSPGPRGQDLGAPAPQTEKFRVN